MPVAAAAVSRQISLNLITAFEVWRPSSQSHLTRQATVVAGLLRRGADLKRRLIIPEVVQTSMMDCGPASLKAMLEGAKTLG